MECVLEQQGRSISSERLPRLSECPPSLHWPQAWPIHPPVRVHHFLQAANSLSMGAAWQRGSQGPSDSTRISWRAQPLADEVCSTFTLTVVCDEMPLSASLVEFLFGVYLGFIKPCPLNLCRYFNLNIHEKGLICGAKKGRHLCHYLRVAMRHL